MASKGTGRSSNDLLGVLALSQLYLAVLLTRQGGLLQGLLGLPFVLMLPGYALLAAIDVNSGELELAERLTISCVLSLATVISVAMGLNVIRRLDPTWLACVLEAIIVAGCACAYWCRTGVSLDAGGHLDWLRSREQNRSTLAIVVHLVTVGCVCAILFLMADLIQCERAPVPTTALYLLGDDGEAGGYVKRVACDSRLRVTVGVVNNQPDANDYSIRIRIGDQPSQVLKRITLEPGQTWEERVDVRPDWCGTVQSVVFDLVEGERPMRSVYQRVLATVGDALDGIGEGARAP
jgi:uncharacterized membrane protein